MVGAIESSDDNTLSAIDKKILKVLLDPNGKVTTHRLAKILQLPRTTIQRRRKMLEERFLQISYSLNLDELGYRRVDLLISTRNGKSPTVSSQLLKITPVVYVGRVVGQNSIDLKAETIIKDNAELINLLETVKGMEGVGHVEWTEIVKVVGRKKSIPNGILDKL